MIRGRILLRPYSIVQGIELANVDVMAEGRVLLLDSKFSQCDFDVPPGSLKGCYLDDCTGYESAPVDHNYISEHR